MTDQEEQLLHQTCFSNQEQKKVIAEQNETLSEIATIVADACNWSTPELVAFHRGFILARCEYGLNYSIIGADPDDPRQPGKSQPVVRSGYSLR